MFIEPQSIGALPRYSAKRNLHHAVFFCRAPEAKQVSLVGDFNCWDPTANPMSRQPDRR
jgi:1,4-alpha-glucan branching enzyme